LPGRTDEGDAGRAFPVSRTSSGWGFEDRAHSFRRANITLRQEVGGSTIEASKIAGHADLEMTGEYTFVAPERQNELTRRIQQKLAALRRLIAILMYRGRRSFFSLRSRIAKHA
jgi:hypothetical protein